MDTTSGPLSHTPAHSRDHWENYWDGAGDQGDARDAAVTGAGRSEAFQSAWRAFFEHINAQQNGAKITGLRLMDLACGGGVVTDIALSALAAARLEQSCLIGADYSLSAARRYSAKFRSSGAAAAVGVVGDALVLPFRSGSVDVVVSQFGLEYAGPVAVAEASRLLAANGEMMCLTHYRSGAIERECSENLRIADEILSSEVLTIARVVFAKSDDLEAMQRLTGALETLRIIAQESPVSAGNRLLTRLSADLRRLVARRAAFDPREVIGWLDANAAEISMYRDRMLSMTGAALDDAQTGAIINHWKSDGLEVEEPVAITMEGAPAPSAWRLRAHRR